MARSQYAARMQARRSMSDTLEQLAPEAQEQTAPPGRALEVGADGDLAERQADAIADQVLGRLADKHEHAPGCGHGDAVRRAPAATAGTIGAAGGALDGDATAAIESARGGGSPLDAGVRREMETGFGHGLGDVRIHTDDRADRLSQQMSARAFTTGRDIFFARGEYDPTSSSGRHTLAHELAHTTQDGGTTRRKLRGTADALVSQGAEKGDKGKSSGFLRKLTGKLTNWDRIVGGVKAYELEESKLLAGEKNAGPAALMSAKPGMLKLLNKVVSSIAEWRKANDSEGEDESFAQHRAANGKGHLGNVESDTRSKTGRRQAVALLEPRIGNELRLLNAKDPQVWIDSLGLSSGQGTATGRVFGGQMNTVTEFDYQTESGDMTGFFKQDKGFNEKTEGHESDVGIRQVDPNYGARSVALYRLDQLFDAKVTARAEFAVGKDDKGKSVLGTVLESAKGPGANKRSFGMNKEHVATMRAEGDASAVGMDDPVLRRGLNKLQILDAISGQLDRHTGNFHVDADDQGNVLSVTGIDLDMAFGANMKGVAFRDSGGAENFKELPEFIDEDMGLKILQVQPGDVRDALTGLLSKAEIEATVSRFRAVQTAVMEAQKNGKMKSSWSGSALKEGAAYDKVGWASNRKTYADNLMQGTQFDLVKRMSTAAQQAVPAAFAKRVGSWQDLPDDVPAALESAFGPFADTSVGVEFDKLGKLIWNAQAGAQTDAIVARVVAEVLKLTTVDRVWVDIQEGKEGAEPGAIAKEAMVKRIEQVIAGSSSWIGKKH
jgi:hypothetical protein